MWQHFPEEKVGVFGPLSRTLARESALHIIRLPNLRSAKTLFVLSDYAGSHATSTHESYAFLLIAAESLGRWDEVRSHARRLLGPTRRMSYKGLLDRKKRAALGPFLLAADKLDGLLAAFVVSKAVGRWLFVPDVIAPEYAAIVARWKPAVAERLVRIIAFVTFLLAGLSAPLQNVFWFTDEDEIVPNTERLTDAVSLFSAIGSNFLPHQLGHIRWGTARCDNGDRRVEDLLAIPDLAAGALSQLVASMNAEGITTPAHLAVGLPSCLPRKARELVTWLADRRASSLRSLIYMVEPGDDEPQWRRLRLFT